MLIQIIILNNKNKCNNRWYHPSDPKKPNPLQNPAFASIGATGFEPATLPPQGILDIVKLLINHSHLTNSTSPSELNFTKAILESSLSGAFISSSTSR